MATPKNRYIIFKIVNSTDKPIQMSNESFLNVLKDRLYQNYGIIGLSRFDKIFVTLFLPHKQIVIFKAPRILKEQIIHCMEEYGKINMYLIKFESLMVKSSIKRIREYLKKEHLKQVLKKN